MKTWIGYAFAVRYNIPLQCAYHWTTHRSARNIGQALNCYMVINLKSLFIIQGPTIRLWYVTLERIIPVAAALRPLKMMLADQVVLINIRTDHTVCVARVGHEARCQISSWSSGCLLSFTSDWEIALVIMYFVYVYTISRLLPKSESERKE